MKDLIPLHKFLQFWDFIFLKYEIDFKVVLKNKSLSLWFYFPKVVMSSLDLYHYAKQVLLSFISYKMDVEGFDKIPWLHLKFVIRVSHKFCFSEPLHVFVPWFYFPFPPLMNFYA